MEADGQDPNQLEVDDDKGLSITPASNDKKMVANTIYSLHKKIDVIF